MMATDPERDPVGRCTPHGVPFSDCMICWPAGIVGTEHRKQLTEAVTDLEVALREEGCAYNVMDSSRRQYERKVSEARIARQRVDELIKAVGA
jgi:hypothetical protein